MSKEGEYVCVCVCVKGFPVKDFLGKFFLIFKGIRTENVVVVQTIKPLRQMCDFGTRLYE